MTWVLIVLIQIVVFTHGDPLVKHAKLVASVVKEMSKQHDNSVHIVTQSKFNFNRLELEFMKLDVAHTISQVEFLQWKQMAVADLDHCPVFRKFNNLELQEGESDLVLVPETQIFQRRVDLFPASSRASLIIFFVNNDTDVFDALSILDDSILRCDQKLDVGLYHLSNKLLFVSSSKEALSIILGHEYVKKHQHASVLLLSNTTISCFRSWGILLWTWRIGKERRPSGDALAEMFSPRPDYSGEDLAACAMTWAHYVIGEQNKETNDTKEHYIITSGYEVTLVEEIANRLGFGSVWYQSPYDLLSGYIFEDNGTWSGMVSVLYKEEADVAICALLQSFLRSQVVDFSTAYDSDYFTWVSPNPRPIPKYLAIVYPLDRLVWACILAALAFIGLVTYYIASREERVSSQRSKTFPWGKVQFCVWFSFGSLLGESIEAIYHTKMNALRVIILTWLLFSFIVTVSYSGNLKAHLMRPSYTQPIESLQDVLDSKLPFEMVLYGEEEEKLLSSSEEPIYKQIWTDKKIRPYADFADLSQVYNGKTILIDLFSGISAELYMKYTIHSSGQTLVHLSKDFLFAKKPVAMAFNQLSFLQEPFNKRLSRWIDTGVVDQMKLRAFQELKTSISGSRKLSLFSTNQISAISLHDLQGTWLLLGTATCLSVIIFGCECWSHSNNPTRLQ